MTEESVSHEDLDRMAESILHDARAMRRPIQDRDSFDVAFEEYFADVPGGLTGKRNTSLREKVFKKIRNIDPKIQDRRIFTKEAKGRDLARDRRTRAKTVVTDVGEYKKKGAAAADLEGYDTPRARATKRGTVTVNKRDVTVKAYRSTYLRGNKEVIVYRDKKGRFVRIK